MEVLQLLFLLFFSSSLAASGDHPNAASIASSPAASIASSSSPAASPSAAEAAAAAPSPSPSPTLKKRSIAPSIAPPLASPSSALDPAQLKALRSLAVPLSGLDPCGEGTIDGTITCDDGNTTRHVVSLELRYCPVAASTSPSPELSMDSLQPLASTLRALAFVHCPMHPTAMPPELLASLESLTIVSSLDGGNADGNGGVSSFDGGSGDGNVFSDTDGDGSKDSVTSGGDVDGSGGTGNAQLMGAWIGKFHQLVHLELRDLPELNASGVKFLMSNMSSLQSLTISNTSLKGRLPRSWPENLTSIDLSNNRIAGELPSFFGQLQRLESLDLSSNNITSHIPESITHLRSLSRLVMSNNSLWGQIPRSIASMSELTYLDLGGNGLNGSVPAEISELRSLRYVDLRDNLLSGVLPFNSSFIASLHSLKLAGNPSLCYDESITASKLANGIARCDQFGNPIVPTLGSGGTGGRRHPSDSSSATNGSDAGGDSGGDGGGGGEKVKKIVWALATTLGAIFLFVAIIVLISKWCKSNKGY